MNRSALLIALVVAGLGVFLLILYQHRFETEASGGERIKLLIAVKPIARGAVVTEDSVATREIPQAYVEDRAIKEVEKPKILGLKVGNPVQAQQTLMWTDLVTSSEERKDLSALVQPGSRAVAVRVSREDSNVALIRPGDYVDIIAVMSQNAAAPGGASESGPSVAVVLLQRVLVLATGIDTSPEAASDNAAKTASGMSQESDILSLSLTLPEGQYIALAAERGHLSVALRNPNDQRTAERIPDITSNQLTDKSANIVGIIHGGGRVGPTEVKGGGQ